jgi:hypothetical protein
VVLDLLWYDAGLWEIYDEQGNPIERTFLGDFGINIKRYSAILDLGVDYTVSIFAEHKPVGYSSISIEGLKIFATEGYH